LNLESKYPDLIIEECCFNVLAYGAVTDIDGNIYKTIRIGNQEWMTENLKVTHYRNGDPLPNLKNNSDWVSACNGAWCLYNNESNSDIYGKLYNWYAVNDSRGLAPEGWHVPTDDEIKELEMYLGMSQEEADDTGWRGTNEGCKLGCRADLCYDGAWEDNSEFNSSGFNFIQSGYRYCEFGFYLYMSCHGYFWSLQPTIILTFSQF